MACILLWSSAVRVHDSQVYRKMEVTRERISCILELREQLLSFQTGFNLINAAASVLPWRVPLAWSPRQIHRRLCTVSSFCPFTLISLLMLLVLFAINLVFLALISMPYAVEALSRHSAKLPVLLPLLLSHQCHQQSGGW